MTAPIVTHNSREHRAILRDGAENSGDTITPVWHVPGQLWQRVAEGRKQVWS